MESLEPKIREIADLFIGYCNKNGYRVAWSIITNCLRLEISNLRGRTIVNVYFTGTIDIQGKKNLLKREMEELKTDFEKDPQLFKSYGKEPSGCATRYDILLPDDRKRIKDSLNQIDGKVELNDNPDSNSEYKAKIKQEKFSLTLTQFTNGTLLLQGKNDKLFDESCDLIEKLANPGDKGVIARFLSSDEKLLELFTARYTPKLIKIAEEKVSQKLGSVFNYLDTYHRKWLIASECICISEIPLPEFSPIVMPASKAFEGFSQKLMLDINLVESDYFQKKGANFSPIINEKDPKREVICAMDKHADTELRRWNVALQFCRNFMMHSDESKLTKVETKNDAEEKLNHIYKEIKEIFEYFNDFFNII